LQHNNGVEKICSRLSIWASLDSKETTETKVGAGPVKV